MKAERPILAKKHFRNRHFNLVTFGTGTYIAQWTASYADNFLPAYTLYADKQLTAYTLHADKKLSAYTLYADKANHWLLPASFVVPA